MNEHDDVAYSHGRLPESVFILICASGLVAIGVTVFLTFRYLF